MPASDERRRRATSDDPVALELPPTVMTELDEGREIDAETVSVALPPPPSLGQPPTEPFDRVSTPPETPPPALGFSGTHPPMPSGRSVGESRQLDERRFALFRRGALVMIGVSMTLGVGVVLTHLFAPSGDGDTPIVVVVSPTTPTPIAPPRSVPTPADFDRTAGLDELERLAVERLGNGDRAGAAAVYRALAERAPHERAFVAAARILAEGTR